MLIGRRTAIKWMGGALAVASGSWAWPRRTSADSALVLRTVTADDAPALQAIMASCVRDAASFFGKCGEWTLAWAQEFIRRCPDTAVLTRDGLPVAFLQIPPLPPPLTDAAPEPGTEAATA